MRNAFHLSVIEGTMTERDIAGLEIDWDCRAGYRGITENNESKNLYKGFFTQKSLCIINFPEPLLPDIFYSYQKDRLQ